MNDMSYVNESNMARNLAPEDITHGIYVSVMHVVYQHVSWFCDPEPWKKGEPAQSLLLPDNGGRPLMFVEVGLPFVLVETATGKHKTLDVRQYRLAKVSNRYGDAVFVREKAKRLAEKRKSRAKKNKSDD